MALDSPIRSQNVTRVIFVYVSDVIHERVEVYYESVIKVLIDSVRVEEQVFLFHAIPLDKFISNHAILMLKGIKINEN